MFFFVAPVSLGPTHYPLTLELDQTWQVSRRALTRGECSLCCLLSQLDAQRFPQVLINGTVKREAKADEGMPRIWLRQWQVKEGEDELCIFLTMLGPTRRVTALPLPSIQVRGTLKSLRHHSATVFYPFDGVTEVTMFRASADPLDASADKQ